MLNLKCVHRRQIKIRLVEDSRGRGYPHYFNIPGVIMGEGDRSPHKLYFYIFNLYIAFYLVAKNSPYKLVMNIYFDSISPPLKHSR